MPRIKDIHALPPVRSQPSAASKLLGVGDAVFEYPGFSRSRLYKLSELGLVPIIKVGSRAVVRRADIEKFIDDAPWMHPRPAAAETA